MRRLVPWMGVALLLCSLSGCSLFGGKWLGLYQPMSLGPEEYRAPPDNDPRYSGPQSYPRQVMTPTLRKEKPFDPRDLQNGMPGMARPSSAGNFSAMGPGGGYR